MRYLKKIFIFLLIVLLLDWGASSLFLMGINKFYGLTQHSQILLIGHSHLMLATDKEKLENETGMKVSKYTREGVTIDDRYVMVDHFLSSSYSDSLKIVFYGVDAYSFTSGDLSSNSYTLFYPFMDEGLIGKYVKQDAPSYEYWIHKLFKTSRYSDALLNAAVRGIASNWDNMKYGQIDVDKIDGLHRKIGFEDHPISVFKATVEKITARGIKVILVNTPLVNALNQSDPQQYERVVSVFEELEKNSPLIEYWDFNHPPYSTDYSIFFDPIHLNPKGQKLITSLLIERLQNK